MVSRNGGALGGGIDPVPFVNPLRDDDPRDDDTLRLELSFRSDRTKAENQEEQGKPGPDHAEGEEDLAGRAGRRVFDFMGEESLPGLGGRVRRVRAGRDHRTVLPKSVSPIGFFVGLDSGRFARTSFQTGRFRNGRMAKGPRTRRATLRPHPNAPATRPGREVAAGVPAFEGRTKDELVFSKFDNF